MNRASRLAIALFLPVFLVVFWIVRAIWLAYVASLTESQLHQRVFDHSTRVALTLWGGCLLLASVLSLSLGRLFAPGRADGHRDAAGNDR
jgi:hypothetical protein